LQSRLTQINEGKYPKHHYWASNELIKSSNFDASFCKNGQYNLPQFFTKAINRFLFRGKSDIGTEVDSWIAAKNADFIYSVCGPLSLSRFYRNCQVFPWVFRTPETGVANLDPYSHANLKKQAGFLCLTPKAEKYFSQFAPSKFIPWCVDTDLFDGKPSKSQVKKPFFLATGKTGRDYETLVKAAYTTKAEIRIIGPNDQKPSEIPRNVMWIDTSINPPDQAIDYQTLKEWYALCTAVCIPLNGDVDDTCGYTNMLEAMAMKKPVLMSRSGCLQIDPESRNFGMLIAPQDYHGWSESMNRLIDDSTFANSFGERAREIVEKEFKIERFNREVNSFISNCLNA
tara:strand:+ start:6927 stop:7952 length:1026 start_codon:yes stop_codon:yes gene_type:complete